MDATGCPDRAELEGFVVGRLSGSEFARVASHVERCGDCETTLRDLDQVADPLLCQLRRLPATDGSEGELESVPRGLIAAAQSDRARRGPASWFSTAEGCRRLGKFELLEQLGVGSFGFVFRARDVELGRMVAIKIPRAGSLASKEDAARLLREARSAAQLKHPGIIALHETGQADDGTFYLVEEFVQGTTLASRLAGVPLPFRQTAELVVAGWPMHSTTPTATGSSTAISSPPTSCSTPKAGPT
jgi:hypothetical protein